MQQIPNAALEQAVLCLLCSSQEQAAMVALRVTSANLFTNQTSITIAKVCLEYIKKYSLPPGFQQLEFLLEDDIKRGSEGRLIAQELVILRKQAAELQTQFVIEQLDHFLESKHLQKSLEDAMQLLDQGQVAEAKTSLYRQVSIQQKGSKGILLNDPKQALSFLDSEEETDYFSSGVEVLDKLGARPRRKTISILIAASGRGKTWHLVEVGKAGLQFHHSVLHVTLEISEEDTAMRYIQSIFSLTAREAQQITVPCFQKDALGNVAIEFKDLLRDSIITKKKQIYQRIADMKSYPELRIKEFPTSSLTVESLSLYLDSLERDCGFKPSLLIIDYPDLMQLNSEDLRISTGILYKSLRGLAVSRDLALVCATQANREGENSKLVTSTNISEDWSKIATSDLIITYSQTPQEKKLGLARLFVAKCRNAEDRYIVLISQAYAIGQFCLQSVAMNVSLVEQLHLIGENNNT